MPNKELRIIIADTSLSRLIQVEKSLNRLDYHRILPLQSCRDLWMLGNAFGITFDVLIANKRLISETESDLVFFCQTTNKVNHALLYGSQRTTFTETPLATAKTLVTSTLNVPGDELIEQFMTSIDPPSPWACLKSLAWINDSCKTRRRALLSESDASQACLKKTQ